MPTGHKTYELSVKPRELLGKKTRRLRREHLVPAVVYGHGVSPMSVTVDQKELERVYMHAGGSSLIDLSVGDGGSAQKVFIHDVQRNPLTHTLSHVDFMVVNLLEEMTTTVPVVLVGEAPAVKQGDGVLIHPLDHVQVRALPSDIPPLIEVDVSGLDEVDKSIYISDLKVPANIHVLNAHDELVAKITHLRAAAAEEEAVEAAEEEAAEAEGAEAEAGEGEA